ncbi:MAG: dienelactone hydrolase family protein [Nannocystaceae bacterium]|nr:dienelactone hydrolase family protein [Nannocystaceae bacterium]
MRPLVLIAACALACDRPPTTSPATAAPTASAPQTAADAPASQPDVATVPVRADHPRAEGCELAAGDVELDLEVGALRRHVLLRVGESLASPPPVVFAWHGFGDSPWSAKRSLEGVAAWRDGIIVAPQGAPRTFEQFGATPRAGWQVHQGELGDRDLALFDAIVAELDRRGCLDRDRVYSTGFSNGGFFTNVLACHRADVLAAAAPTGGGGPFTGCDDTRVPILVTHGHNDTVVPFASAQKSIAIWTAHNGCNAGTQAPKDGCIDAKGCREDSPVRVCAFGIDHVWPAGQSERVTEFLRGFRKPRAPK